MAASKRATHVVVHRNWYFTVGGKKQKMPVGMEVTLTDTQAKKIGDKVKKIGDKKSIDLTPNVDAVGT